MHNFILLLLILQSFELINRENEDGPNGEMTDFQLANNERKICTVGAKQAKIDFPQKKSVSEENLEARDNC